MIFYLIFPVQPSIVVYHKHISVHDQSFEISENAKISTGLLAQPIYFCLVYKFLNKLDFTYARALNFSIKTSNVL